MHETPNIVLIIVDQWRWDCLGAAGHPVVQTPHLDVLAADGTYFRRAYSGVPSCIAARRPHPPLDPPPAYLDLYRDALLPPLPHGDWVGGEGLPNLRQRTHFNDSPKALDAVQIERARRAYYAQCTFIDHQLNRLIMALIEHQVGVSLQTYKV